MFGLGKDRSAFGKWIDKRGIKQQWVCKVTGLNKVTISKIATEKDYIPSGTTMKKVLQALRQVDPKVKQTDFWDM
ncbi:transcriptional regulator [Brevibacillus laterosporus]|uniref:transcriptional regulator n=1 Tax=Brevibacillus laterosporus TaxID=1465 RepID=UPI003D24E51B